MSGAIGDARVRGRYPSLDAIRGVAVLGILGMNIVSFGLPICAYADPTCSGGARGGDLVAWALAYAFLDGKMRLLFTLLFGASVALTTDHVARPIRTHYARMSVLLGFGLLHAVLFWYGDILVEYALVGAILFLARHWPVRALVFTAVLLVGLSALPALLGALQAETVRAAAGSSAAAGAHWAAFLRDLTPDDDAIAAEIAGYRGGWSAAFATRLPQLRLLLIDNLPYTLLETLGFASLGLALYRLDFPVGGWSRRGYAWVLGAGIVALALYVPLIGAIVARGFDPVFRTFADLGSLALRPVVALGYAAALILLVRARPARMTRLAAVGRLAFSNYLATTLIATTLFYGYGAGLFGRLSRAELALVMLAIQALILIWSPWWLARVRYGPFEWLWRSLARGRLQPWHQIG